MIMIISKIYIAPILELRKLIIQVLIQIYYVRVNYREPRLLAIYIPRAVGPRDVYG